MRKEKGIIFYTSNSIDENILGGVCNQILRSGLPIVSCSLKPMDFGQNIVLKEKKGIMTYFKQIITALEASKSEYVWFCEHDVLYPPCHFDFTPPRDDTFYYDTHVWKWNYYSNRVVTYDHQASLSGMCANRELALEFYRRRMKIIYENGYDEIPTHGNPEWARSMGYEPGKHGSNKREPAKAEEWRGEFPMIDIRHTKCMTVPKMQVSGFRRKPVNWQEDTIENLPGWNEPWKIVNAKHDPIKSAWIDRET